jgi:hypothetical protein
MLAVVIVAAVLVSRSCGATQAEISQEEAIVIAKRQVSFEPDRVVIRLLKQGIPQRELWLVGLAERLPDGTLTNITNVRLDADTGEVVNVQKSSP